MRIQFLKEWMKYRIGESTEAVAPGVADVLITRRIAVAVPAEPGVAGESAATGPPPASDPSADASKSIRVRRGSR